MVDYPARPDFCSQGTVGKIYEKDVFCFYSDDLYLFYHERVAGNSEYYARLSEKINTDGIKSPSTFETGDIAIYNNISLVIFYADTKNTAGYAKIGHITEAEGVKDALKAAKGKVIFTHMSENNQMRE